jgi:hypothetical protein
MVQPLDICSAILLRAVIVQGVHHFVALYGHFVQQIVIVQPFIIFV